MITSKIKKLEIPSFDIIRLIGTGSEADVYLARQHTSNRPVALKVMCKSQGMESIRRFHREIKMSKAIRHHNVIQTYDLIDYDDFLCMVMEYVDGQDLEVLSHNHVLEEMQIWRDVVLPLCEALNFASSLEIIHRDIKPANIILNAQGKLKLGDFGLSKHMQSSTQVTERGVVMGTPAYMSPEQASNHNIDLRSDIYSLGATIYHVMTGNKVFDAASSIDILFQHKMEKILPPQVHKKDISPKSNYILAHMLAKCPENRYQNYRQVIEDVNSLLQDKPFVYANKQSCQIYKECEYTANGDLIPCDIDQESTNYRLRTSVKLEKQYFVTVENFATRVKNLYQKIQTTMLPLTNTSFLLALDINDFNQQSLIIDGEHLAEIDDFIPHVLGMLDSIKVIPEKENFAYEIFGKKHYQAFIWNRENAIIFVYIDALNTLDKISKCHANAMILKNVHPTDKL